MYTLFFSVSASKREYMALSMDTTSSGVILEQMDVKPTTSLKRMVTDSKTYRRIY